MHWSAYGDAAWITTCENPAQAAGLAEGVRGLAGVRDCWAAFEKVIATVDPLSFKPEMLDGLEATLESVSGRKLEIPVCYSMGEDLLEICARIGLTVQEFIAFHSGQSYEVKAIGFAPGFAYLGSLPDRISGVSRHQAPRQKVEPGSVAITETYTAVYPSATPGGWQLIGRTPLTLVDEVEGYFGIQFGDAVSFKPIAEEDFASLLGKRL